ncbi:MAG TPA: hypothetical protein PLT51_00855 [Candidatus Dojkabacteria bacterium]|nr:hypothetical protein [Candidatus Dojkabacteria bacterium]
MKNKKQLIIVGIDVPQEVIEEAKRLHPDHEVIVVSSLEEWKKMKDQFGPESIPLTRPKLDDLKMPYIPMHKEDMNKNNL